MDIADINKVANRKSINEGAEKLRENVARETKKIIQLKVAQDTAYWDLKEKYDQLEKNHERLQQNMVNVQMQLETMSGKYQEELRLRPETLNKLAATRKLSDVLEEYLGRLAATLARSQQDSEALRLAHARSGQIVRDLTAKHAKFAENSQRDKAALEEKYKLVSEHCAQLSRELGATRQSAVEEQRAMLARLAQAQAQKEELMAMTHEMARELDGEKRDRKARDQNIATLQSDMQRLTLEGSNRCAELSNTNKELEKQLKALQKALASQEEFTNSICSKNNSLQEQIAKMEEEGAKLMVKLEEATGQMEESTITCDALRRDVASLLEAKDALEKERDQLIASAFNETENLKSQLNIKDEKITSLVSDLAKATEERAAKNKDIEALKKTLATREDKLGQMERCREETRASNEEKIKELTLTLETKKSEIKSKSESIAKVMNDITICLAERSCLEKGIAKKEKEMEIEREKMAAQIEKLQGAVKEKDQEIAKQITIIMECRGEKEKLQNKIEAMQSTIENVRHELAGRPGPSPPRAEQDDNACMSPVKKMRAPAQQPQKAPRPELKDSMIYGLLTDSSMDDMVDSVEIDRRFDALARGERLPPAPLSTLRRRKGPRATTAQSGARAPANNTTVAAAGPPPEQQPISLSQLRGGIMERKFFKNKRPGEAKMQKRF